MSTSPRRAGGPSSWRPSLRALLLVAAAFAIGLLLFLLLWWRDRDNGFYRAESLPAPGESQPFEPLPAPLPAGEAASGMGREEERAAAQAPPDLGRPPPPPAAPAPPAPPPPVAAAGGSTPVPIESPAPQYPREALRNGESGTVVLRVHVGPDGRPFQVDLVQSSHSRALDRAANDAVQRWRFRPAMQDGQPVSGVVQVPIAFNADG